MPTNRRKFLAQTGLAASALLTVKQSYAVSKLSTWVVSETEKDNSVILLHTNDIQNAISTAVGGFHRTCEHIQNIRKKHRHSVLLDAGNSFSGDKRKSHLHDQTLSLMNSTGYEAVLPGVKDLKCGADHLSQRYRKFNLSGVASNYRLKDFTLEETIQPFKIIRKGKWIIGVIAAGRNPKDHNVHVPIIAGNPLTEMTALATKLKNEQGCHLVVCLSQLGYRNKNNVDDITLARQSKNIDVIIGGYSCTFMQQPTIVLNQDNAEVIINHAGKEGMVLGTIEIAFTDEGHKKSVRFTNHLIGRDSKNWKNLA